LTAPGTTKTKAITVTNSGGFDAILGDVSGSGLGLTPPFSLVGGSCATGLSVRYNWLNSNQADRRLLTGVFGNGGKHVIFGGLTTSDPVTTYSENGYTIRTVTAAWTGAERLIFYSPPSTTTVGEVRMTAADGGTFLLNSVDLYSSLTPIPFVIEGRLDSATVFSLSDTLPSTSGAFVKVNKPSARRSDRHARDQDDEHWS
jgi:hypothetical protein